MATRSMAAAKAVDHVEVEEEEEEEEEEGGDLGLGFFGNVDNVDLSDSDDEDSAGNGEGEGKRAKRGDDGEPAPALPGVDELLAGRQSGPSYLDTRGLYAGRHVETFDTRIEPKAKVFVKRAPSAKRVQEKAERAQAMAAKNSGLVNEITAAAQAMSSTYQYHKVEPEDEEYRAYMVKDDDSEDKAGHDSSRKASNFNSKEKRKRDLGQTSRGKSYVEEEKRLLRQQSAQGGYGFD
ncbi:uncharacterized protein MONBRDRAFT_6388 [Monosiga brevicollis MX1]|uniref:Uncharacterized protein n=1 Tax=Monosiga brevicollis TaxID=81824 RepID=A9UTQ3_MONBE|nr:uncharacterized protein MONBRDRAFT_6388 [Monosiga brevicollis MX1]EDQ91530.1 predicted protein [Monosiga brevicollis MX1]|eukprot:XP_001743952.1 hypothetical protein [Monosiga brevicollis MX1]